LEEAAAGAVMDTRRYAKRQVTWFRNQMKDWPFATPEEAQKALEIQLARL
jgi:IPP transferase.